MKHITTLLLLFIMLGCKQNEIDRINPDWKQEKYRLIFIERSGSQLYQTYCDSIIQPDARTFYIYIDGQRNIRIPERIDKVTIRTNRTFKQKKQFNKSEAVVSMPVMESIARQGI